MTQKIFRSICLACLAVFLSSLVLIMGALYGYFSRTQLRQLQVETALAAQGVSRDGADYFDRLDVSGLRFTWIAADGSVLYDSASDSSAMENHLEREEIQQALSTGTGTSTRYSSTLLERLLYAAQRLPDGTVLRLASSQYSVVTITLGTLQPILLVAVIAVVLALVLASRLSKRLVRPLNELDLDDPLSNDCADELAPLLRRIDSQQRQLRAQQSQLRQRREEFAAVTNNMSEGLLLLSAKGAVLSINPAAARLLGTDKDCVGQDLLSVNRSLELQNLIAQARAGRRAEAVLPLSAGSYQIDANPVVSDGAVSGVAVLMFDVTERESAEQMRREFTANVSHELKTPLHSISGCAELLLNGMVKSEDVERFSRQIYTEAQRMITLVDDIIRLSRLDEGAEGMQWETVDLFSLAEDTVRRLSSTAQGADVSLTLTGEDVSIRGIPQLLEGIVYNLCDNAIKYNRPGGSVTVNVRRVPGYVQLSVADTGIGIPPEHQGRVFERFYRVDKSHSKEVGGTGLGLSIVKHAARIHNAQLDLRSTPGEGTTITVRFPLS